MQTKHTPTPYKTKHLGGGTVGLALVNADYEINGLKLGCIYASKDAEFIVRACNSHDELVEANRLAISWLKKVPAYIDSSVHASMPIAELEHALAKAEGKGE